jgi:hypothetical protein
LLPLTIVQSAADAARIKGARSRLAATGGKTPISRLGESFAPNTGDLAAADLARFLSDQRITPASTAFIFTKTGEVIALPDAARIVKTVLLTVRCSWRLPRSAI